MSEVALPRFQQLAGRVRVGWTPARAAEVRAIVNHALAHRGPRKWLMPAVLFTIMVLASCLIWFLLRTKTAASVPQSASHSLELQEGTVVDLESQGTLVQTLAFTDSSTDLRLVRGSATFRPSQGRVRTLSVYAGALTVTTRDGIFRIDRNTGTTTPTAHPMNLPRTLGSASSGCTKDPRT